VEGGEHREREQEPQEVRDLRVAAPATPPAG
jgi:hypothetical protein